MRNIMMVWTAAAVTLMVTGGFFEATAFAQNAAAGKAVYVRVCQTCHAPDGSGNAKIAKAKKLDIKALNTDEVSKKTDAELKKIITEGGKQMEPIKGLSAAELDNVIAYVRTLKK